MNGLAIVNDVGSFAQIIKRDFKMSAHKMLRNVV
jgi:hypothetical protein